MLVLTRKLNESILIGEEIKVVLLGIEGDRVKLGIEAPSSMRIFRTEMLARTIDENKAAVVTQVDLRSLANLKNEAHFLKIKD